MNKKIYLSIIIFCIPILLLCVELDIDTLCHLGMKKPLDVAIGKYNFIVAFTQKFIVYNFSGEIIRKIEKLKKNYSRKIITNNDKIINILGDKHILQIFQNSNIVKEIDLKKKGISIVFSCSAISDSSILLLTTMNEEENEGKYINHYLLKMNINTKKIDKICSFGRIKFSLDYVFKQDPINEKMCNVILGEKEFIVLTKDSIDIRNLANKSLKKVEVNFPVIHIDEDIKEFYNKQKPFMMKFVYPQNSPRIYKLYPMGNGRYLIDIWAEKAKRIKSKNLQKFILYYYEDGKFSEIVTDHNPDNFMKVYKNKIAIYNDSKLTIGEILIK
ncbi:MAG: hypothetical protein H8D22_07300 [Candidatus Cloacimonetes bacterium]|nr:hypothetical protein [Candidatus Cloacimonadota bacterium]